MLVSDQSWKWGPEHEQSWSHILGVLKLNTVLHCLDPERVLYVWNDGSARASGSFCAHLCEKTKSFDMKQKLHF